MPRRGPACRRLRQGRAALARLPHPHPRRSRLPCASSPRLMLAAFGFDQLGNELVELGIELCKRRFVLLFVVAGACCAKSAIQVLRETSKEEIQTCGDARFMAGCDRVDMLAARVENGFEAMLAVEVEIKRLRNQGRVLLWCMRHWLPKAAIAQAGVNEGLSLESGHE